MDKRIVLVSLLVIVGAVSISGCLGSNEEQKYNEQMTLVYNDISGSIETTKSIDNVKTNEDCDKLISTYTKVGEVYENDTKILTELSNSINNDTRKEYIKLCMDEIKLASDESKMMIDLGETIKKANDNQIPENEAVVKVTDIKSKLSKSGIAINETNKKLEEYEGKYPFVLINGTLSMSKLMSGNK